MLDHRQQVISRRQPLGCTDRSTSSRSCRPAVENEDNSRLQVSPLRSSTAAVFRAQIMPSLEPPASGKWTGEGGHYFTFRGSSSDSQNLLPSTLAETLMVCITFPFLPSLILSPFPSQILISNPKLCFQDISSETYWKMLPVFLYLLCPLTTWGSMVSIRMCLLICLWTCTEMDGQLVCLRRVLTSL